MCDNISSDRRGEAAAQLCLKRRLTGYAPGSLKLRVSVPAVVVRVKERCFNSMIELTPEELAKYANNREWIDVCKER